MEMIAEGFSPPILLRQKEIQPALAVVKGLFQGIRDSLLVAGTVGDSIGDNFQGDIARRRYADFSKITDLLSHEQPMEAGLL
jgi:hypothetical protein